MFYLLALAIVLLGAGIVLFSLLKPRRADLLTARETTVAALYQDRLDELRREMASGQAEAGDRAQLEAELSAALLADYQGVAQPAGERQARPAAASTSGVLALASAALLIALSVVVYLTVGDPGAMRLAGAEVVLRLDPDADRTALGDWRERLSSRVEARPADAKSWYLLGHVDLKLGQFAAAAEAFAMAQASHGEDPSIDLFWLQARYMAAGGQIDATTRSIAQRVLDRDPNQPLVLEMYAIDAYRQGDFRQAVTLLNRALSAPLAASHQAALKAGFAEARKQLGDLPAAVDVEIQSPEKLPGDMTLFVIARPVGGGMPFAVVKRRPVGELPITVRLDDAVSMNPDAPMSSAAELEVVVRLSRSGTAMAHPGDWEWRSEPLEPGARDTPARLEATLKPPA